MQQNFPFIYSLVSSSKKLLVVISGLTILCFSLIIRHPMTPPVPKTANTKCRMISPDTPETVHPGQEHWMKMVLFILIAVTLESLLEHRRSSLKLFHLRRMSSYPTNTQPALTQATSSPLVFSLSVPSSMTSGPGMRSCVLYSRAQVIARLAMSAIGRHRCGLDGGSEISPGCLRAPPVVALACVFGHC